jgi:hypothetical protein
MKELIILFILLIGFNGIIAQSGINTSTPDPSAILDVFSNNKGFLPPRLTTAQRDGIAAPIAGLTIYNTTVNCLQWWNGTYWYNGCTTQLENLINQYATGTVFCESGPTAIVNVTNPVTGEIWMDRNLGASQAATSSTDADSYGDLYQWGRGGDGHQCRTSNNTELNATVNMDSPGHGDFIIVNLSPFDWRSPQNGGLWQGVVGINNPCPSGYRVPTRTELNAETASWVQPPNAAGAITSPIKLTLAGGRSDGSIAFVGTDGYYWSSTVNGANSSSLRFDSSNAGNSIDGRAFGASVRCIKD